MTTWTVGDVAERTGLSVRTLHHWEAMGLVSPARRTSAGYRLYGPAEVERLLRILGLQQLGLSLAEIGDCLDATDGSLAAVLVRQIERLEARIAEQRRLRDRLRALARRLDTAEGVSADEMMKTLEAMKMFEKHYTEEQLGQLAERHETIGEARIEEVQREWAELIPAMRAEMERGTDPGDPKVQELARRWSVLVAEFTGGDAGLARSAASVLREEPEAQRRTGLDPALMDYVRRAGEAGRARG